MHVGCKCNVVIATCPQRYLESTFLRCHNVVITTLSQPKDNVATTLSQRDFVCWDIVDLCGTTTAAPSRGWQITAPECIPGLNCIPYVTLFGERCP